MFGTTHFYIMIKLVATVYERFVKAHLLIYQATSLQT